MSHLIVFLMVCVSVVAGEWIEGIRVTHPIAVAGLTLLAHWILTR